MSWNGYETNVLLRNDGPAADGLPRYTDVAMAVGADDGLDARGLATADLDHDGDLDLVINNNPGDSGRPERARATLLRNELGSRRAWLTVELVGTRSNRDAIGALVTVTAGGQRYVRQVNAGSGYASQSSRRLSFGLGGAERVDELTVSWPAGGKESFAGIAVRQGIRITEGQGLALDVLPRSRATQPGAGGAAAATAEAVIPAASP